MVLIWKKKTYIKMEPFYKDSYAREGIVDNGSLNKYEKNLKNRKKNIIHMFFYL
jgi:hypothetical protein